MPNLTRGERLQLMLTPRELVVTTISASNAGCRVERLPFANL
jgi:hypothetical protein